MHEKRSEQEKTNDPALELSLGKGKPTDGKMPNTNGALPAQSNNPPAVGMKLSASLRHCKSFNSKDSNKAPKSNENTKIFSSKSNGALSSYNGSKVDVSVELNGDKVAKSNGNGKSEVGLSKPKPISSVKAPDNALSRSDSKVKSPGNGSFKNSSYHVNGESQKKSSKETSPKPNITTREADPKSASSKVTHKPKETSPKPAFAHVKNLSLSLNADPQQKLPPIKTSRTSSKSSSAKNTANLCTECKAEVEGAVCFIGNDGRVSACTSRNAVRLCKNLKCANNNPEFVASLAAASAAPKKYLVSRRHSLPWPTVASNGKSGKAIPDKMDAQALSQNSTASPNGDLAATLPQQEGDDDVCHEFDMKGELEEDVVSPEDHSEEGAEFDGIATASPQGGRLNGHQRMKRRSFNVIETQAPAEVVTLRKQLMQERKQAEEWMLDYAIEEALQKLAPSKESKVKALVEAFESVIPQKDVDGAARDHQAEAPKTPNKIAIRA